MPVITGGNAEREYYCTCGFGRVSRPGQLCPPCNAASIKKMMEPKKDYGWWIFAGFIAFILILNFFL